MMKRLVILFVPSESHYLFEKSFLDRSAFERSLDWAKKFSEKILVLCDTVHKEKCNSYKDLYKDIEVDIKDSWTNSCVLEKISNISEDFCIFAFADCPFLNFTLTKNLLDMHEKYIAEYTFADGYPYGFAPEILDKGAATILHSLIKDKEIANKKFERNSLMEILKLDINSFEIETLISPKDFRLYRFEFACGNKAGFLSCKALFDAIPDFDSICDSHFCNEPSDESNDKTNDEDNKKLANEDNGKFNDEDAVVKISEKACTLIEVLKTVPCFYNIQIESQCPATCTYCPYPAAFEKKYGCSVSTKNSFRMSKENFSKLVNDIEEFSENAVVCLSLWGEPLLHPDFLDFVKIIAKTKSLSILIETDGLLVNEDLCRLIKEQIDQRIIWIVSIDAASKEMYKKMRGQSSQENEEEKFSAACKSVKILSSYFEEVYPQFVRTNENEVELENFYRYWKDDENASKGKLIIQKYDYFAGLLENRKPADLSPLERNPCWHLRRDITILADGSVPICREHLFNSIVGNVFTDGLEETWKKLSEYLKKDLNEDYSDVCRNCDEYYTFNF